MKPASAGFDEGFSVLKTILSMTQTLRKRVAENDLDAVEGLLEKRRKMLEVAIDLVQQHNNEPVVVEMEKQLVGILKAIRHEDKALLGLLTSRKQEVLGSLQAYNNQRLLAAYSH